jgi:hypothetical protein
MTITQWLTVNRDSLERLMNNIEPRPASMEDLAVEMLAGSLESWTNTIAQDDVKELRAVSIKDICPKCGQVIEHDPE